MTRIFDYSEPTAKLGGRLGDSFLQARAGDSLAPLLSTEEEKK